MAGQMNAAASVDSADENFCGWLSRQIGKCKWVVGRKSKKKIEDGYDTFFTQRRFTAIRREYEKEIAAMSDAPTLHLTEPNQALAKQRRDTFTGMAFWGGTGPDDKTCRMCSLWAFDGYAAGSGLLRDAGCSQYARMTNVTKGPAVPHFAKACKYFQELDVPRSINKPK